MEESKEKCIGKIIHNRMPIEWMRFNMYIETNVYRNIPILVFRIKETCPEELVGKLEICIEDFKGKKNWKLFKDPLSRKGNYLISIAELEEMRKQCYLGIITYNEKDYFGIEEFKKHCEDAIEDIPLLAKHIEEAMR